MTDFQPLLGPILLYSVIFAAVYVVLRRRKVESGKSEDYTQGSSPSDVCTHCGYIGKPTMQGSTNGCFAVALLLCFIIPGILYIIFTSRQRPVCPKCRTVNSMIPLDTPQGRALTQENTASGDPTRDIRACPYCGESILAVAIFCKHCRRDVAALY